MIRLIGTVTEIVERDGTIEGLHVQVGSKEETLGPGIGVTGELLGSTTEFRWSSSYRSRTEKLKG